MSRVVFVMIDGLRPDALDHAPTFQEVMRRGASTTNGRSVVPSITLPCHMSIYHSVPPATHGIFENEYIAPTKRLDGLIETLKDNERRCACFTNWEFLRDINRPGSLKLSFMADTSYDLPNGDRPIVDTALPYVREGAFDFTWIYLGCVDTSGHAFGWMSEGYLQQVATSDAQLARIVDVLPADATLIVHSDHGGHDYIHGTELPADMTIPWAIMGPQIPPGVTLDRPISLLDTAPTIATILGVPVPESWEGIAVTFPNTTSA